MSTDRQECHEEITRNGELQPCERPAVGYRVDPAHDVPYPVCRPHLREPVFVPPLQLARIGYLGGKFAAEKRASYWKDVSLAANHAYESLRELGEAFAASEPTWEVEQ